jgi:hypothetical protein
MTEINEKFTPEGVLNIEDSITDGINSKLPQPIKDVEKDIEKDADAVFEDIYPEGKKDLQNAQWYEYIFYFRWIVNLIFFAMPYFAFSCAMVVVNIVLNIFMNKWWAGGHWLLIFNTFYLITQTVMSWPLIFELPFYLTHLRFFRIFSVMAAWAYSLFYFLTIAFWIGQLYLNPLAEGEDPQFFDILINMVMAYVIIFNIHIIPVNLAIIVKEISLEIFPPLLKQDKGTNLDIQDIEDSANPKTYIEVVSHGKLPDQEKHKNDYKFKPYGQ